jgi:hypothetical protein
MVLNNCNLITIETLPFVFQKEKTLPNHIRNLYHLPSFLYVKRSISNLFNTIGSCQLKLGSLSYQPPFIDSIILWLD